MPRKRPAIKEERHGALVFRQAGGDHTTWLCRDPEHPNKLSGSGRWKVELLGFPLLDAEGSPLRVCDKCRVQIAGYYNAALCGYEEAEAA